MEMEGEPQAVDSPARENSAGIPRPEGKSAELVYQHVQFLWQDEAERAKSLVERRRTFFLAIGILVTIIGLVRDDFVAVLGLLVSGGQGTALAILVASATLTAVVSAVLGAWWLLTDRRLWVAYIVLRKCPRWTRVAATLVIRSRTLFVETPRESFGSESGRAIHDALPDERVRTLLADAPERIVWEYRSEALAEAFQRLVGANRRVNARIKLGALAIFLAYLLVLLLILPILLVHGKQG